MEALSCGVPLIVTQDTGMKEHVAEGVNGFVISTGSVDEIVDPLEHIRSHPLCPLPTNDGEDQREM